MEELQKNEENNEIYLARARAEAERIIQQAHQDADEIIKAAQHERLLIFDKAQQEESEIIKVAVIGKPNAGKSTLMNNIIKHKIAITSPKAQTTRNIIQGIYNEPNYQIVFIDTPGIHKPLNKLGKVLNKEAQSLTKDVDAVLLIVDAKDGIGTGDKKIIESSFFLSFVLF